jgi:hypothetical protein
VAAAALLFIFSSFFSRLALAPSLSFLGGWLEGLEASLSLGLLFVILSAWLDRSDKWAADREAWGGGLVESAQASRGKEGDDDDAAADDGAAADDYGGGRCLCMAAVRGLICNIAPTQKRP